MYWIDEGAGIQRANLDGSQVEESGHRHRERLLSWTRSLARCTGRRIRTGDYIQRANLDGTNIEILWAEAGAQPLRILSWIPSPARCTGRTLRNTIFGAPIWTARKVEILWAGGTPGALALDLSAGKMYWSDIDQGLIRRADLDGTNVEVVVDGRTYSDKPNASGLYSRVYWLAIDGPAGKLYWTDNVTLSAYRANLDGSAVARLGACSNWSELGDRASGPGHQRDASHRTGHE